MKPEFDTEKVQEVVAVIWIPMLRSLDQVHNHYCPCFGKEHGLCPCPNFINKLECKCGMFILKEVFVKKGGKIERVKVNG